MAARTIRVGAKIGCAKRRFIEPMKDGTLSPANMEMTQMTGLTIKAIAEQHGLSPRYTNTLTNKKGFPDPKEFIGRNKIYSPSEVAKFFADQAKRREGAARRRG